MSNHTVQAPLFLNNYYVEQFLQNYYKTNRLKVEECSVSAGSKVGDNYSCQILRLHVLLSQDGEDYEKSIIAKIKPNSESVRKMEEIGFRAFEVESCYFTITLPEVLAILKKHKVENNFLPQVLFTDDANCTIFMEDLKSKAFVMIDRTVFLGREECLLVAKALGSLHAASYVLLKKDPTVKTSYQFYFWKKELHVMKPILEQWFENIEKAIDKWNITPVQREKVLNVKSKIFESGFQVVEPDDSTIYVLSHGDCWKNNLMYRYENGKVKEVCLIDFQNVNYNSFANDLIYFLFVSAEPIVILEHLEEFFSVYLTSFCDIVPGVIDIESVKREFEKRLYAGLLWFLLLRPVLCVETPPDIDQMMNCESYDTGCDSVIFVSQVEKIIPYFEKMGIL